VNEVIELSARKADHSMRQGAFESLVQYSDHFRATYRAYKENCSNIDISEKDQAMDFSMDWTATDMGHSRQI
jgi:hypothetical protein